MAVHNIIVDTGEVASSTCVPSASIKDASLAIQGFARRPNVDPKVMSTDTWPNGKPYFYTVFSSVVGFLGLFHFLNHIRRTMRDRHIDFPKAWRQFMELIYSWNQTDYHNLTTALVDGTLTVRNVLWTKFMKCR